MLSPSHTKAGLRGLTQGTGTHIVTPPSQPGNNQHRQKQDSYFGSVWPGSIPLLPSTRIPLFQPLRPCHCFPPLPSSSLILQHCVLLHIPSLPSLSLSLAPHLLLALPTLCFRGFYEFSCIPTPLIAPAHHSRLCYVRLPALACTCFLPHHRPRWWSPVLRRLRPSSRGKSSRAGCTVGRQWSESLCRKTQERAGREMMISAGERCQVPPWYQQEP